MRILFIPHAAIRNDLKIRTTELAGSMAKLDHEIFVLTWFDKPRTKDTLLEKVRFKFLNIFKNAVQTYQCETNKVLSVLRISLLIYPLVKFKFALNYNQRSIQKLCKKLNIDVVINANPVNIPIQKRNDFLYIYDLVDDHINGSIGFVKAFTLNELRSADSITTISHSLSEIIKTYVNSEILVLPNGCDVYKYRRISSPAVDSIKEKFNLKGKFLVGYIGNHKTGYSNIEFLLKAMTMAHKKNKDIFLIAIGPIADNDREIIEKTEFSKYLGVISPDTIHTYYQMCDLGVLPFTIQPFTDNSMPLKIIEFGAAQKRVIASPLSELKVLNLPYVSLIGLDPKSWAEAIEKEFLFKSKNWKKEWDEIVDRYDWAYLSNNLNNYITNLVNKND